MKCFDVDPTVQDYGFGHYDFDEVYDLAVAEIRKLFPDAKITREEYLHRRNHGIVLSVRNGRAYIDDIERGIGERLPSLTWIDGEAEEDGE